MTQLILDFNPGTRICIVCKNNVDERWAIDRQKKVSDDEKWVCSNCWNNIHYTTRIKLMEGKSIPDGLFRNAKKTQSKNHQTKSV